MCADRRSTFRNGYWIWDELNNGLLFVSKDLKDITARLQSKSSLGSRSSQAVNARKTLVECFSSRQNLIKSSLGNTAQTKFKRFYQRKVRVTGVDVVLLQDVKDVAIYMVNISILSQDIIRYFHIPEMDRYLRSLIIYFQYYFQIWTEMQSRRQENSRKIRFPRATVLEDVIRDNLSDLRSMLARDYAVLILGIGEAKRFHHMNTKNNTSLSDKDRRMFETFMILSQRIVWIALHRKFLLLIEKEMNRLFRTDRFNTFAHSTAKATLFDATPEEQRILIGKACKVERKAKQRSPAIQEIVLDDHDYRMMAIGVTDPGSSSPRLTYLEIAYTAPEEILRNTPVTVGILGYPRRYFDTLLTAKKMSTTQRHMSILKDIPDFEIPPFVPQPDAEIAETLPDLPCKYEETQATQFTRRAQYKIWRDYVEDDGIAPRVPDLQSLSPSYATLRASIGTTPSSVPPAHLSFKENP